MQAYQEIMQGYNNLDKHILTYATRLWRNLRESFWDEEHQKNLLYDMLWAQLQQ
jgi:hypothetical protein